MQVGRIYRGRVTSVKDFGAFVEIIPGKDGLCHISELSDDYVNSVGDVCSVGDELQVKVIAIDEQDRVKLSRKQAMRELAKRKRRRQPAERHVRTVFLRHQRTPGRIRSGVFFKARKDEGGRMKSEGTGDCSASLGSRASPSSAGLLDMTASICRNRSARRERLGSVRGPLPV